LSSKVLAQQRADRIRAFREELDELAREGVLSLDPAQNERLLAHHRDLLEGLARRYDVDVSETQRQMSLGMRIASFLGALALSAAVYFFFHRIWGHLGTPSQVVLLVAAPLLSLLGVEAAARRERTLYVASILAILAFACFVLNLNVLGTIFNIIPSHNALLAWGAFAGLLAYGYGLRLALTAALVCGIGWLAAGVSVFSGMSWDAFWQRPESILIGGAVVFSIPAVMRRAPPEFPPVYRLTGLIAAFLAVLILAFFGGDSWIVGGLSWLPMRSGTIKAVYQLAAFGLSAAGIWLGIRKHWPEVLHTSAAMLVICLYAKFFDWWWRWMPKYVFFLILGVTALAILLLLRRLRDVARGGTA